jgi:4,5-dihydroxyphthalate decarboxylase
MKAMFGDHAVLTLFRQKSGFEFEPDVKVANQYFKRVVRNLEFDVAELAIMTFLLAKAHGKPLRLLPAVLTARFQHPYLVTAQRISPRQLEGKRVGSRSYSVTTASWVRGILADDYGVDLSRIQWVTFEEPHVAEFRDPPNVERAPAGKDMNAMLLSGELAAGIVGAIPPADGPLKPVIENPEAAGQAWKKKHGAIQINHMVVVRQGIDPKPIYDLLVESRKAAGNPEMNPFGIEENRRNLEAAIDCIHRQGMIPRRYTVEELFE